MAPLLNEILQKQISEAFSQLKTPVNIMFFGKKTDCEYCDDTHQMVEEVASLSEKIKLDIFDLEQDSTQAKQFNVDKAPGIVIAGQDGDKVLDYGIRISGIPSGHEFRVLINDLILVSGRDSGLSQHTRDILVGLTKPVLLQVYVTPT
jgi:alkyl hydroperoxide reductase subunit AhpF